MGNSNRFNQRFVNPISTQNYDKFWKLDIPEFIVASDTHAPFIHEKIVEMMFKIRNRYKIPILIHPGDFFDDLVFSTFLVSPEDIITWDKEIESARAFYNVLKKEFSKVYFTLGNHDVRFWKKMMESGKSTEDTWRTTWNLIDKNITVSKYRYCEVNDYWRITHPKNPIRLGGFPAIRIRAKFDRSMVFAHGHWWGQLPDPSSKYYLIGTGCLCDPAKIAYASMWDTSFDLWHPGFLLVVEKVKPILFDLNSPFGIYLK